MAKLLTDEIFATVRGVINDVCETFLQKPAVLKKMQPVISRFKRDNDQTANFTDYDLPVLSVIDKNSNLIRSKTGLEVTPEFYLLVNFDVLDSLGLVSTTDPDQKVNINPASDYIIIDETRYNIIGNIDLIGQWKDRYCVAKIFCKKPIQND